jgi:hypothetical protein
VMQQQQQQHTALPQQQHTAWPAQRQHHAAAVAAAAAAATRRQQHARRHVIRCVLCGPRDPRSDMQASAGRAVLNTHADTGCACIHAQLRGGARRGGRPRHAQGPADSAAAQQAAPAAPAPAPAAGARSGACCACPGGCHAALLLRAAAKRPTTPVVSRTRPSRTTHTHDSRGTSCRLPVAATSSPPCCWARAPCGCGTRVSCCCAGLRAVAHTACDACSGW